LRVPVKGRKGWEEHAEKNESSTYTHTKGGRKTNERQKRAEGDIRWRRNGGQ